ncbi:MAG: ABC transporter ATP-binding protein [Thermoguttaceae bacterium]
MSEKTQGERTSTAAKRSHQDDGSRRPGGPHLSMGGKTRQEPQGSLHAEDQHQGTAGQLTAKRISKSYHKGQVTVPVLRGVDLTVKRGEFVAVIGESGSGKSTLLHVLGTLDAPDRGEVHFGGRRIDNLPGRQRDRLRNRQLGMIFQFYHLLPELSTLENVLAPLMIGQGTLGYFLNRHKHRRKATELLDMVGLGHRLKHKPSEISGGEMQRAAIARALVASPELLLADEPTGNLDHATGEEIMEILRALNQRKNLTIVMVTHDRAIAQQADRIVRLVDGRIEA